MRYHAVERTWRGLALASPMANVSEETKTLSDSLLNDSFADGFREMYYVFSVSRDAFDLDAFRNSLAPTVRDRDTYAVPVAPLDENNGPYYVIFRWRLVGKELGFFVSYRSGPKKHERDEHEPYAEQFMSWFAKSFKQSTTDVHVHARFAFPLETRRSEFPLPQAVGGAEVFGITMRVPAEPNGVTEVALTKGESRWYVEVIADRTLSFDGFTPYADVHALASFVDSLWATEAP